MGHVRQRRDDEPVAPQRLAAGSQDRERVGEMLEDVAGEHDVERTVLGRLVDQTRVGEVTDDALGDTPSAAAASGSISMPTTSQPWPTRARVT